MYIFNISYTKRILYKDSQHRAIMVVLKKINKFEPTTVSITVSGCVAQSRWSV